MSDLPELIVDGDLADWEWTLRYGGERTVRIEGPLPTVRTHGHEIPPAPIAGTDDGGYPIYERSLRAEDRVLLATECPTDVVCMKEEWGYCRVRCGPFATATVAKIIHDVYHAPDRPVHVITVTDVEAL